MARRFKPSRAIETAILECDEIPQLAGLPDFPWETLAGSLKRVFDLEELSITAAAGQWISRPRIESGMGAPMAPIHLVAPPHESSFAWLMSERDYRQMMGWALLKESGPPPKLDTDLRDGFRRFIALEVMHCVEQAGFVEDLVLRMAELKDYPEGPYYCVDVTAEFQGERVLGRLVVPQSFMSSWKQRYRGASVATMSPEAAASIDVILQVEAGRTQLPLEEWQSAAVGDFLLADEVGVDPRGGEGVVTLLLGGRRLCRAQLTPGSVTITEMLDHQAQEALMDDDDFDDFDDFDDDDFDEEDEDEEESAPAAVAKPKAVPSSGKMVSPSSIPLTVVFEVGRMSVTAQELMDMKPGNVLEIDADPTRGVDLIVNNRLVGKGELVTIGDALGVRLTEKG